MSTEAPKPIMPLMTNMSAWHAGGGGGGGGGGGSAAAAAAASGLSDKELRKAHDAEAKAKENVFFEDPCGAWPVRGAGYLRGSKAEGKGVKHAASFAGARLVGVDHWVSREKRGSGPTLHTHN